MKARSVNAVAAIAARRALGELPAREAAELPVRRRRRPPQVQAAYESFRDFLGTGRTTS
jgi:hypothetical protein